MQALSAPQLTLQLPVHTTSQLAPSVQLTLLLAPTVTPQLDAVHITFELSCARVVQTLPGAQVTLHEEPHA